MKFDKKQIIKKVFQSTVLWVTTIVKRGECIFELTECSEVAQQSNQGVMQKRCINERGTMAEHCRMFRTNDILLILLGSIFMLRPKEGLV